MSSRATSKKIENSWDDFGNGQDVINPGRQSTSEKSKVDFIYEAVPCRSKHDIILVLQSCDYNVDAAISIFSQGRAKEILNQWSPVEGKKNKNVNKKKQNKKKHSNKETVGNAPPETKHASQAINGSDVVNNKQPSSSLGKSLSLDLPASPSSTSPVVVNGISPTSDHSPHPPVMPSKKPSQHSKHHHSSHHSSSHHSKHTNDHSKHDTEKLSPTSRSDALKKSTKDLQRSSFSLARYQVVLEEECDQSFKSISKTFESIRKCINEREQFLTQSLKEFKEEAEKLLQQRLEDASALKLKTERVHSLPDEQVALLRADIKSFVAERKLDEELAQTKRFVCDEEKMLQDLKTFGQVVPIKGTYTPVVLNHILPTTASKTTTTSHSTSSRITNPPTTTPSTQSSPPTSSHTSTRPTTTDKPSAAHYKNADSQSSSSVNSKTTATTSQAQSVNKSKNTLQHQTTESQHTSSSVDSTQQKASSVNSQHKAPSVNSQQQASSVESQRKAPSAESQHKASSVDSQRKVTKTKATVETQNKAVSNKTEQKDTKTTSEPTRKGNSHQAELKDKRTSHAASTETKPKERNVVSSSKSTLKQQVKDLSHTPVDLSTPKLTGPPPKISALISLAMAKSSAVVSEGSKDSESKHQETARTAEQKRDGRNRGQRNRPNTAPEHQDKPQRNRESRSNRSQSTRQRRDKENDSNPVNTANGQEKTREDKQSEQAPEGRRRRQRRRARDRKPKEGEATPGNHDNDSRPNRNKEEHAKIDNEKEKDSEEITKKNHQSKEGTVTNKEDSKDDMTITEHVPRNDHKDLQVVEEKEAVSQTDNVSTTKSEQDKENNLELPEQIMQHDDAPTSQTGSVDQKINKDEQLEKSKDSCPSPKKNGVDGHADDLVDKTTEETNDHKQGTDGALPQRPQHRRRNRGPTTKSESDTSEDHNGSTNGVGHETANGDKDSSEISQDTPVESVGGKISLAPSLINGQCNGESVELDKHEENKSEIQESEASSSSSTADECLVER